MWAAPLTDTVTSTPVQGRSLVGRYGVNSRPPVPPETVHRLGHPPSALPDRQRGLGILQAVRVRRVSVDTRHTDEPVDLFVEGNQVVVSQRPVLGDTIQTLHPEVAGHEARP